MICIGEIFVLFCWHLSNLVFSHLPRYVVWCLTLIGEILSHYCFTYFFCCFFPFFSYWNSHYAYVTPFVVVPQSLYILFFTVFVLCFSVLKIFTEISSSAEIYSLVVSSLLSKHSTFLWKCFLFVCCFCFFGCFYLTGESTELKLEFTQLVFQYKCTDTLLVSSLNYFK